MAYDLKEEYKKWAKEKNEEEKVLKENKVSKNVIKELKIIDKKIFNKNRNYYRFIDIAQNENLDLFSKNYNFCDNGTLESLLNELENEAIYEIIKTSDALTYQIIDLKLQGYTTSEISIILNIDLWRIYKKVRKIKEILKKSVKFSHSRGIYSEGI